MTSTKKYIKGGTRKSFNGKTYQIYSSFWNKRDAENDAKRLRKQGSCARITKQLGSEGHYLYNVWFHN